MKLSIPNSLADDDYGSPFNCERIVDLPEFESPTINKFINGVGSSYTLGCGVCSTQPINCVIILKW